MSLPTKLVLIRHAESARNKALDGKLFLDDPKLMEEVGLVPDHKISITKHGMSQAKRTSQYLYENIGIPDIVFHSGYARTKQTTEGVLNKYKKNKIEVKENLAIRERENGYTYILMQNEKDYVFPYLQKYWDVVGGLFARPVGGESLMDVVERRLQPFLEKIFKEYSGKTIFLVTHGRIIQCIRFILDEMTHEEMEVFIGKKESLPKNCSLTIYELDKKIDKLKLKVWNKIVEK